MLHPAARGQFYSATSQHPGCISSSSISMFWLCANTYLLEKRQASQDQAFPKARMLRKSEKGGGSAVKDLLLVT